MYTNAIETPSLVDENGERKQDTNNSLMATLDSVALDVLHLVLEASGA